MSTAPPKKPAPQLPPRPEKPRTRVSTEDFKAKIPMNKQALNEQNKKK